MEIEIITPKEVVARESQITRVVIPASWGQMEILPGYADYMTTLDRGTLTYVKNGEEVSRNISGGILTVSKEKGTVLVDDVLASVSSLEEARQKKNHH